jgi:hypothetical protein
MHVGRFREDRVGARLDVELRAGDRTVEAFACGSVGPLVSQRESQLADP